MSKRKIVRKGWGREVIFASNPDYCGKILEFDRKGAKFSMHHHVAKDETWYCLNGEFLILWLDPRNAKRHTKSFKPGSVWHNAPGMDHRIECIQPGQIAEVSTRDDVDDNFRVEPGDSQNI